MSDQYTPTTVDVKAAWRAVQLGRPEAHAEFERWLASVQAEAWDAGHKRERDYGIGDCRCAAWNVSECGCGKFYGPLIDHNPYRNKETP